MAAGIEVIGADRLPKALASLPVKMQRKAVRKALNFAATPIIKSARSLVPVDDGDLKRSLGKKVKVAKRPEQGATLTIGPRTKYAGQTPGKRPASYAHLVEFGTAPHQIEAKPVLTIGPLQIRGVVQHPGAAPRPFLRPAFEASKSVALRRFSDKLGKEMERLAEKGAR